MIDVVPFLLDVIKSQISWDALVIIIVLYSMVKQRHAIELSAQTRQSQFDTISLKLATHIAEEEKEFKHIDERFNSFSVGMKILQDTMLNISNAMDRYAITNHEVLDNDISQIDAVIYMSATSVSNILKNSLLESRKGITNIDSQDLIAAIASDVEEDRRRYHAELVTKGVSTKTIGLWEETEAEAFESFMFRIVQTFEKLVGMKGNGTVDKLIERECELLRDYLHGDFMKRLKRRLSVIK